MIKEKIEQWETVVGLEIHAQNATKSKLFSNSSTEFGKSPNCNVSFVDAAFPGVLPVINVKCVEQAIKAGLALNAKINLNSSFERKSYFYPDLPRGNQITQFTNPIVGEGYLNIICEDGAEKKIRIMRIHLEDDAGKSIHDKSDEYTCIDLNRAGIGLMEIVTAPDFRSGSEVSAFLKKLRTLLRYIEVCDGNMEEGSMRCDANISVRKNGTNELSTKVEIKNLNSIKHISKAISYESKRQIDLLENGGIVEQETRLFDADSGVTKIMRSKEDAIDYRYSDEPDLLPLSLTEGFLQKIKENMKESLDNRRVRYIKDLGLQDYDVDIIMSDFDVISYFDSAIQNAPPQQVIKWIITELFGLMNKEDVKISDIRVTPDNFAKLVCLVTDGKISAKIGKEVLVSMFQTGRAPDEIIKESGMEQISDSKAIEELVSTVLSEYQDRVLEYKNGKEKLFYFFVGEIMKKSGGKANPTIINEVLKNMLHHSN